MNNIIGVTGFARSGKDTFYKESAKILSKAKNEEEKHMILFNLPEVLKA